MPFNNLESRHFTAAEKTTINGLLAQLETAFANKTANLTPEERKKIWKRQRAKQTYY